MKDFVGKSLRSAAKIMYMYEYMRIRKHPLILLFMIEARLSISFDFDAEERVSQPIKFLSRTLIHHEGGGGLFSSRLRLVICCELHQHATLTTTLHSPSPPNMDLNEIIEAEKRYENSTGQSTQDFVAANKSLTVPYLVLSVLISIMGTGGNLLIIAAVCVDKVSLVTTVLVIYCA